MVRKKGAQAKQPATEDDPPKRVTLRNTNPANGEIGGIATPLEKDAQAWLDKGWVHD